MKQKMIDHKYVLSALPDRKAESHKADYGKLLLLCGSRGYTGAAALACMGALRCGAGLVFLGVPESIYEIEAVKLNEPIVFPLPDRDGMYAIESLAIVEDKMTDKDAILIGPGIGRSPGAQALVMFVLKQFCGPVVLDADGINLIAGHKDILRGRMYPTILTPHSGEFERLTGERLKDRITDAMTLAADLGVILVLKGHHSVITDGNDYYVSPTGNPGMAVGGSGDILAGVITGFLGQKLSALDAALCGAWVHGAAGDICAEEIGQCGMLPTDLVDRLPRLLK